MIVIPHVETNITLACTNRCVGCNHFAPIQPGTMADPETIRHDLDNIGKVAKIQRFALIGGEPTLHKRIDEILQIASDSETVGYIEVWTNGARLADMTETFWQCVNEIDLTLYPGKPVDVEWLRRKCTETFTVLKIKNGADDFTQLIYEDSASDSEASERYANCFYGSYCHVLDNGYFYRCCTSPFIPKLLLDLPEGTDGIPVEGITEQALVDYLNQKETPASCYRCAGHAGKHIGWRECSREDWLKESVK